MVLAIESGAERGGSLTLTMTKIPRRNKDYLFPGGQSVECRVERGGRESWEREG